LAKDFMNLHFVNQKLIIFKYGNLEKGVVNFTYDQIWKLFDRLEESGDIEDAAADMRKMVTLH
jgi:hypothetical protein